MELYISESTATSVEVVDLEHPGYRFRFEDLKLATTDDGSLTVESVWSVQKSQVAPPSKYSGQEEESFLDNHSQRILKELLPSLFPNV